jgi:hypothetical protein
MSLNKKAALDKKRSDAEEARMAEKEKLNPRLPYKMLVFPYDFFGVDNLIATKKEKAKS